MESTATRPARIVQIVPEVRIGSGVEAVAFHLEQQWQKLGVSTARFTLADAAGGWLPAPGPGVRGKIVLAARVVWFSTVGTVLARRMLAAQPPGTVSVCHNDVLAGDIYVNHGLVAAAMKARGNAWFRIARNPLHLFVLLRDAVRFAGSTHHAVINLCGAEQTAIAQIYRKIRPQTAVIGNGVDVERYRPDAAARARVRSSLGLADDTAVGVFVGHEFDRKGLPLVLEAMRGLPNFQLLVIGGTPDLIAKATEAATVLGVHERVRFLGRQPDVRPYLHAADVFVFPSAYESYGLVILEALACGVPVVATGVGCVPDVVRDGVNGAIVDADADAVRAGVRRVLKLDAAARAAAARSAAADNSWESIAQQYINLLRTIRA